MSMDWGRHSCGPKPILAGDVCSNSYDPGISLVYGKGKSFKMVENPGERLIFALPTP